MTQGAGDQFPRLSMAAVALLASLSPELQGAEWTRGGSLGLTSFWTSNICRAALDEQDEVAATVLPRINVAGRGARAQAALDAAVEYNTLQQSDADCGINTGALPLTNREPIVPRINFSGQIEALNNFLFLESDAFAAQNPINPFIAGAEDNLNGAGNTNITYRWGVGARANRRFSENWRARLAYRYNEQTNSADQVFGDSQEDRFDLQAGMVPGASRLSLTLIGNYSEVTFDETVTQPEFSNRLARLELRSFLQMSDAWQLIGAVGEEDNVFISNLEDTNDIDGSYWDAGLRWAPNSRVTVEAGYGERFFGETPRFSIQYRHKRMSLRARYVRSLQFPRNLRATGGINDPGIVDPDLPPGTELPGAGVPTFVGQQPVLNEQFLLGYNFRARRTNFFVNATYSEQRRTSDGGAAEFLNATAGGRRRLGPVTSIDWRLTYIENTGTLGATEVAVPQEREQWLASIGLTRRLANRASLSLRYQYSDQSAGGIEFDPEFPLAPLNRFEEHRVTLGLQFNFGRISGGGRGNFGQGGFNQGGLGQGGF